MGQGRIGDRRLQGDAVDPAVSEGHGHLGRRVPELPLERDAAVEFAGDGHGQEGAGGPQEGGDLPPVHVERKVGRGDRTEPELPLEPVLRRPLGELEGSEGHNPRPVAEAARGRKGLSPEQEIRRRHGHVRLGSLERPPNRPPGVHGALRDDPGAGQRVDVGEP